MNKCYVYTHTLGGKIVYIGRGTNGRIFDKCKRSKEHLDVWNNLEFVKVKENLTVEDAANLEKVLIDEHWCTGNLFNRKRDSGLVKSIIYSDLISNFYYDESSPSKLAHFCDKFTGEFNSVKVAYKGMPAGYKNKIGYYSASYNGKSFLAHRLVYSLVHGIDLPNNMVVDHIDGNRSNNSISNLRLVSKSENSKNKKHKTTNTGYQAITDSVKKQYFSVGYRLNLKAYRICFSYNPKPTKNSRNHYPSRNAALAAAIAYRDSLVEQGLIILTNKEEQSGIN